MQSNLSSCLGVFIPTTSLSTNGVGGHTGGGYYRYSGSSHPSPVNETKRNKRILYTDQLWSKIEEDFTPELLEEHKMNIPDIVHHSPKQTSSMPSASNDDDTPHLSTSATATLSIHSKKLSALFVKPDINIECLYRKSGIREELRNLL